MSEHFPDVDLQCTCRPHGSGFGMGGLVELLSPRFEGVWSGCRPVCSSGLPVLSTVPSDSLRFGSFLSNSCDASWAADEEREEDSLCVELALRLAMALSAEMLGVVWVGYMARSSNSPYSSSSLKAWWSSPWPKTGPDVLLYGGNSKWT